MAVEVWQIIVMAVSGSMTAAFLILVWWRRKQLSKIVNKHRIEYKLKTIRAGDGDIPISIEEIKDDSEYTAEVDVIKVKPQSPSIFDVVGCYKVLDDSTVGINEGYETTSNTVAEMTATDGLLYIVEKKENRLRIVYPHVGWISSQDAQGKKTIEHISESSILDLEVVDYFRRIFKKYSGFEEPDQQLSQKQFLEFTKQSGDYSSEWTDYNLNETMYWCQFFRFVMDMHRSGELAGFMEKQGYIPPYVDRRKSEESSQSEEVRG